MAVDPFARPDVVKQVIEALQGSEDDQERVALARKLRNLIIGNRQRKTRLGTDHHYLQLLAVILTENEEESEELRQECATVLGIVAIPDPSVLATLLGLEIPEALAACLGSRSKLLLSALVALRNFSVQLAFFVGPPERGAHVLGQAVNVLSPGVVSAGASSTAEYLNDTDVPSEIRAKLLNPIFESEVISNLMAMLHICISLPDTASRPLEHISLGCEILSALVRSREHQTLVLEAYQARCPSSSGASTDYIFLEHLIGVLQVQAVSTPEHILSAISALVRRNPEAASRTQTLTTSGSKPAVQLFGEFLEAHRQPVRLAAAICITNLHKAVDPDFEMHFTPALRFLPNEIIRMTIVTLLRLLDKPSEDAAHAAFVLAYLVSDDNRLQSMARDLGAFSRLEGLLKKSLADTTPYPTAEQEEAQAKLREGALLAVASLSLTNEKNRKSLIDADLLGHIIGMLCDPFDAVRGAACQCARALSRSVGVLRTHLIEAGSARPLFSLLEEDQKDSVVMTACATLANMLIELSPMKEILLRNDFLPLLIRPIKSSNPVMRLHGLLALKNLAFWAESSLKETLMKHLTWEYLSILCSDPDQDIQAQALGILRNVACNKVEDVDTPLDKLGTDAFLTMLEDKLESPSDQILVVVSRALNILQNLVQSPRGKQIVLKRQSLLLKMMNYITHTSPSICVPAVWTSMSLARRDLGYPRQSNENAIFLRSLGFEERLREARDSDPPLEVRERVSECLEHFDAATFRLG